MTKFNKHNGFKIIALVPLKNCDQKFLKNLNVGIPYLFYNNYEIKVSEDYSSISNIKINKSDVPVTLYNLDNGIKVNVSAVVGANGSGKSALIELYYYFVYAFSSITRNKELGFKKYSEVVKSELEGLIKDKAELEKLLKEWQHLSLQFQKKYNKQTDLKNGNSEKEKFELEALLKHIAKLEKLTIDKQRLSVKIQKKYYIQIDLKNENSDYDRLIIQAINDVITYTKLRLDKAKVIDNLIDKSLNLSVVCEVDNQIYIYEFKKGNLTIKDENDKNVDEDLAFTNFFYSISLNYSHHSLNSKILGEWITGLFHKNDGYSTPVVINPMRTDGMFDINHELELSKERLMFNLAYYLLKNQNNEQEYKLLNKYNIKAVNFSIKPTISPSTMRFNKEGLEELSCYYLIKDVVNEINSAKITHLAIVVGYLDRKLEKIRKNYHTIIFKDFNGEEDDKEVFFQNFILNDNSHITKKINQVLNYLKCASKNIYSKSIFNLIVTESISFTSLEFISFIKGNEIDHEIIKSDSLNVLDLMNYLPPSIFNIDFELSLAEDESILLSQLSSGEQQMIFNINTILYHLYNLQSSFYSNNTRLVYKNISIILDEIELYYHPEMQRQILDNLLVSLELVKEKEKMGIESINLCFLTHSPFILSDIPSQNILRLKDGKPDSKDTINSFAANIYDLLKDEFFLHKGTIGALVSRKISSILSKNAIGQDDWEIINLIGDPFFKGVIKKKLEEKLSDISLNEEIKRLQEIQKKRITDATNK